MSIVITMFSCFLIPFNSFNNIFLNTFSVTVHYTKKVLSIETTIFCSFLIPLKSFYNVYWNTITIFIYLTKTDLRFNISALTRFLIPLQGFINVYWHPKTIFIIITKFFLVECFPLFCFLFQHLKCLFKFRKSYIILIIGIKIVFAIQGYR